MVFWSRIRSTTFEPFSYRAKSWCSQITGVASIGTRIRVLEKKPDFFIHHSFSLRFFAAPVQAKPKPEPKDSQGVRINNAITAEFIRLVSDDGHGIVSKCEALDRAKKLKLDLVEVQRTAEPPVCKIMDFHREKYKQEVKEKERVKSNPDVALRKGICKEVRFAGKIDQKDLQMKAEMVKRLMERGYRVKCMAMGKEDEDLGGLLSRFSDLIEDVSVVESGPRVEKRHAFVIVKHSKFGPSKKSPGKKAAKIVEDTGIVVQKAATSTPTVDSASPVQMPLQIEEQEPVESGSETEDEILSEEVHVMNPSYSLTTTPREIPNEDEKKLWSAFDASDDFEKICTLNSIEDDITSSIADGLVDNVDVHSPTENVDRTELLHQKLPVASVVNGSDLKQRQIFGSSTSAKEHLDPPKPVLGSVRTKAGFGNEQTTRVSMPDNISSPGPRHRLPNQVRQPHQPPMHDSRKRGHFEAKQEQPTPVTPCSPAPSYGIFSSLKSASSDDRRRTSLDINRDNERKLPNSTNSPKLSGISPNPNPSKSEGESQRQDTDKTGRGKWGIFSR